MSAAMPPEPYKQTPIFDQDSLPDAIRNAHSTKQGVCGLLTALEGSARLVFHDPKREVAVSPGEIAPEAVHHVEIEGPVRLQVSFYRAKPLG